MLDVSLLGDQILCVRLHVVRNESGSDDLCLDGRSEEENDRQAALSESERVDIPSTKGHSLPRKIRSACLLH